MLARLLSASRYIVLISVLGSLLASLIVTIFAGVDMVRIVVTAIRDGAEVSDQAKYIAVGAIELIELFLLGTVLYVVALGLYQLFIDRDIHVPHWLEIHTLDNLKERLLGTIIVILAVSFVGFAVTWDGGFSILALGVAVGLVMASIAYTLSQIRKQHGSLAEATNSADDDLDESS
jgi:uncharacterized membrane protein YqhA